MSDYSRVQYGHFLPVVVARDSRTTWAMLHVWALEHASAFWERGAPGVKTTVLRAKEIKMNNDLLVDLQRIAPRFGDPLNSLWLEAIEARRWGIWEDRKRGGPEFTAAVIRIHFSPEFTEEDLELMLDSYLHDAR